MEKIFFIKIINYFVLLVFQDINHYNIYSIDKLFKIAKKLKIVQNSIICMWILVVNVKLDMLLNSISKKNKLNGIIVYK